MGILPKFWGFARAMVSAGCLDWAAVWKDVGVNVSGWHGIGEVWAFCQLLFWAV